MDWPNLNCLNSRARPPAEMGGTESIPKVTAAEGRTDDKNAFKRSTLIGFLMGETLDIADELVAFNYWWWEVNGAYIVCRLPHIYTPRIFQCCGTITEIDSFPWK